jgi:hypothetical protein
MKNIYKYGLSLDEYNMLENNEILWFKKHLYSDLKSYSIRVNHGDGFGYSFATLRTAAIKLGWINDES